MVSPRTSARYSASSTSLSFSGRMIATTSFIWLAPVGLNENRAFAPAVSLFAVLGDIHADALFLLAGAKRCDQSYHFQNHERADDAIQNRSAYRGCLDTELLRVSEQRAIGGAVPDFFRQHTGQQRPDRAAHSVRRHDVE